MKKTPVIYGRYSRVKKERYSWGKKGTLFTRWGTLKIHGFILQITGQVAYADCGMDGRENLCIVEEGAGTLLYRGQSYPLKKGYAFKIFPGQDPELRPRSRITLLSIQMPQSLAKLRKAQVDFETLHVVNPKDVHSKVYEFETLAQEIFTPEYSPGLGLIKFVFPIDAIPLHRHPFSGRLIRPISGKGYTYAEPNIYEMKNDSFTLFPRNLTHTNGPVPGNILRLWAVQLPWVKSGIDHRDIAGSPKFVKYVGPTPPRKLWKKKEDFLRVIRRFSRSRKK